MFCHPFSQSHLIAETGKALLHHLVMGERQIEIVVERHVWWCEGAFAEYG
jgi:hypothetical protein